MIERDLRDWAVGDDIFEAEHHQQIIDAVRPLLSIGGNSGVTITQLPNGTAFNVTPPPPPPPRTNTALLLIREIGDGGVMDPTSLGLGVVTHYYAALMNAGSGTQGGFLAGTDPPDAVAYIADNPSGVTGDDIYTDGNLDSRRGIPLHGGYAIGVREWNGQMQPVTPVGGEEISLPVYRIIPCVRDWRIHTTGTGGSLSATIQVCYVGNPKTIHATESNQNKLWIVKASGERRCLEE